MATLSWGSPNIYVGQIDSTGALSGKYELLSSPKEDTTQLTGSEGDETEAKDEAGRVVDVRYGAPSYELEFSLFVKKGVDRPSVFTEDNYGNITGEHKVLIVPEDTACLGVELDRVKFRLTESYSKADGILLTYKGRVLAPASGKIVKPYTYSASDVSDATSQE